MIRRRLLSVLLVVSATPSGAFAQQLPIRTYTAADGLAHNEVRKIVRDSLGFLWFCTAGGLSRFDGYGFTNFGTEQGLPSASVNNLLETRTGQYWIATDGGLVLFRPKGHPMFTTITADTGNPRANFVNVAREGGDGTIWVGTNDGLFRVAAADGRQRLQQVGIGMPADFPEQRAVADLLEDRTGSLWIAAPSGLFRRWSDGTAARYTVRDGLPSNYMHNLYEDREGHLWGGTLIAGLFRFRSDAGHATPVIDYVLARRDGLVTGWVFQIFQSSDGRFWDASARGLVEFFPDAKGREPHVRTYGSRNGIAEHDITALAEDRGGNLWMGAFNGAMKFAHAGFTTYGEREGIHEVTTIFEDQAGQVCFRGTVLGDARASAFEGGSLKLVGGNEPTYYQRFGCFDGKRFDWFAPSGTVDFGWVTEGVVLHARNGDRWVGTAAGLAHYGPAASFSAGLRTARPLAVYTTKDGLASPLAFRLFEDSRSNIWISTISAEADGLSVWEPGTGALRDLTHSPGLPPFSSLDDRPRSFGEDRAGQVWLGFTSGLARYSHGRFTFFAEREGLPHGAIMDIHADRSGRVWLASALSGLIRVDNAATNSPAFVTYTAAQGLASNDIAVITEDDAGRLYLGGARGLDRFDPATGHVRHFGPEEGLAPARFVAALRDRQGVFWFGTGNGLVRFEPSPDVMASPVPLVISGLRVSGVPQLISALGEQHVTLPDLRPDQNQLEIDFIGAPGEMLRYQYRLEGGVAGWSAPSDYRTVTFATLAPGRYAFDVRAVNPDATVGPQAATVAFRILSPLWMRWWFLTLAAGALIVAVHAAYRYRVSQLVAIADLRTRIATDLHDDIGANLTRIALLSEVANQTRGDVPPSPIARIARESVSTMGDIVWAINPKRETLLDLTRRMRQHAEEVFAAPGVSLDLALPNTADKRRLGVDVRRDLLLVFKEAVNNVARHSRASAVSITLSVAGGRLTLIVADNGVGFDATLESDGQGLASMQRRARRLNGTLEITSAAGTGTTVRLSSAI